MSQLFHGDCLVALPQLASESVDFILTDPPYLVNFRDRSGRSIANDVTDEWLAPAFAEMFRVLKRDTSWSASMAPSSRSNSSAARRRRPAATA